jgi:hypothetical protein
MGLVYGYTTPENKRDYPVGRGKPPVHTRSKIGQSATRAGPLFGIHGVGRLRHISAEPPPKRHR